MIASLLTVPDRSGCRLNLTVSCTGYQTFLDMNFASFMAFFIWRDGWGGGTFLFM